MPVFEMSFSREGFSFGRTIRSCVKEVLRARSSRAPHRISASQPDIRIHGTERAADAMEPARVRSTSAGTSPDPRADDFWWG